MPSKILKHLNLTPDERLNPPKSLGKIKTIHEWASAAADAVKENKDFLTAIQELSPWADALFSAAKDSFAPIKFVVKIFEELTKIQDPEDLARLACTIAYQSAAEKALAEVGKPANAGVISPEFDDTIDDVDFSTFTLGQVVSHPFVTIADRILQHYLPHAGYNATQVDRIVNLIHDNIGLELERLLSDGKTKDKFDPLSRWLNLPSEARLARAAIRRHGEYVSWLFNEAPVLQCEPYALADVCIAAECSKLTHADLHAKASKMGDRALPNPFAEGQENGGRHDLLDTVMSYIRDLYFRDAIVIQGSAGSGKSTFTIRLAEHLKREGLKPIRIRLRDVILDKEFYVKLGEAISFGNDNDLFIRDKERFSPSLDILQRGGLFEEQIRYQGANVCPYVVILDGWDEISVAVAEGFRQKVKELLLQVRQEFLRPGRNVRVILTGRPSDAIDDCPEFFREDTPILTVRVLDPKALPEYASRLGAALEAKRLNFTGVQHWTLRHVNLSFVFDTYANAFKRDLHPDPGDSRRDQGVATVLGYPLLLHFTFRLLVEGTIEAKEIVDSAASLLRRLVDFATSTPSVPSDRERGAKILPRLAAPDLRALLRATAAQMTILGQENISRDELARRLAIDPDKTVSRSAKDNLISAMLVSFYFRGGNSALGCEFTHKAFREYLFAEEIVEVLKKHAHSIPADLPERPSSCYWKDFEPSDPRLSANRDLAAILAPQWLSLEVVGYLERLLEWDVARSYSDEVDSTSGQTDRLPKEKWPLARTLLADLWDLWGDGVHMRRQPSIDEDTGQLDWSQSFSERLVPRCSPLAFDPAQSLPTPIRTTTLDSHLGDALFRLCAWVHYYVGLFEKPESGSLRRYQSRHKGLVMFRPSGNGGKYFDYFCARISGAGWRPNGVFPGKIFGRRLDFSGVQMHATMLNSADLTEAAFIGSRLFECSFNWATAPGSSFRGAMVGLCSFVHSNLARMDVKDANIWGCRFSGANLREVDLSRAAIDMTTIRDGDITVHVESHFDESIGLDEATITTIQNRSRSLNPKRSS